MLKFRPVHSLPIVYFAFLFLLVLCLVSYLLIRHSTNVLTTVWLRKVCMLSACPALTCTRFGLWGGGSHFQNGWHEFSMSHISANNIDRKLIIVSMPMFSGSRNPNVAIILVCEGCGSHFQNGRCEFSMPHILANNGDRKLMLVSMSMFSGSKKPNRINIICQSLVVFQNNCHIWILGLWQQRKRHTN